jgi:hypothetical protein
VPYRPFGKSRGVPGPWIPVGDQWPDPPEELQEAVDGRTGAEQYNRFERAIYGWLAAPHLLPRRWRRHRAESR